MYVCFVLFVVVVFFILLYYLSYIIIIIFIIIIIIIILLFIIILSLLSSSSPFVAVVAVRHRIHRMQPTPTAAATACQNPTNTACGFGTVVDNAAKHISLARNILTWG